VVCEPFPLTMADFAIGGLPKQSLAFTNCVYVCTADFARLRALSPLSDADFDREVDAFGVPTRMGKFVFSVKPLADGVDAGTVAVNGLQRRTGGFSLGQRVGAEAFVPSATSSLESATMEVSLLKKRREGETETIECADLLEVVRNNFNRQVVAIDQLICVEFHGVPLMLKVTAVAAVSMATAGAGSGGGAAAAVSEGQVLPMTTFQFVKAKEANIKLQGQGSSTAARIFRPDFDFQKLGIGGLDHEFSEIFRRAFASRVFPASIVKQMGMQHVRGMLLFGPPGCGKTLIARKLGQCLNAREPKVVNGPEILNKYVGASEENIRELFAEAEAEQEEMGDDSELHIIIMDEMDAICKSRGTSGGSTGVGDSVVNQLLSKIDGVDSLNNVLLIGMTNRKDMIDDALLRPGRLEVHVEIGLPSEAGRAQILQIHTRNPKTHGYLDQGIIDDIWGDESTPAAGVIADLTKNFSGAEIEGLIRNAVSTAFQRGIDGKTFNLSDPSQCKPKLLLSDVHTALEATTPAFGINDQQMKAYFRNGIVHHGAKFDSLLTTLRQLTEQVRTSDKTPLLSVLLEGKPQTGKTALAAHIASESGFPFVRMISADTLIGYSDMAKCNHFLKAFQDSYKSPLSMIIIDDIERCLDYTPIGPRFNNQVLQALLVLTKRAPPTDGRKLMVVGITSVAHALEDLELTRVFDFPLHVPELSEPEEIKTVLREVAPMSQSDMDEITSAITQPIGVKKLLTITEMARQSEESVSADRFIECLHTCGY